jgi:hypothetical protein
VKIQISRWEMKRDKEDISYNSKRVEEKYHISRWEREID